MVFYYTILNSTLHYNTKIFFDFNKFFISLVSQPLIHM